MEHRFGRAAPFALGMEEELLLLDASSGMLAHESSALVPRVAADDGTVMHDVYEALIPHPTIRKGAQLRIYDLHLPGTDGATR